MVTDGAEEAKGGNGFDSFSIKWLAVAFLIYVAFQALALAVLPTVIASYDPQGLPGLGISAAVWFLGGILVGRISPGRTYLEPVFAAVGAAVPTILYISQISDHGAMSSLGYVTMSLMGVVCSFIGAFIGEKLQDLSGR
jgi:CDP-diglyceride synthetase